ncbi:hypothetical protein NUW54_g8222 [Trametes sanguinea]|uniref:Uncharacterized protein n=1 Tax=Trametes sanguinea TaxID=158606 RepID=A0ACC1PI83_9APHY|nr:hypothetical protein NUW54_g8222 [Trametes sanguinea]
MRRARASLRRRKLQRTFILRRHILACGGWLRLQPPLFRQSDASFVPRLSNTLSPEVASPILASDAPPGGQVFRPSESPPDSILVLRNTRVVQPFVCHPLAIEQRSRPPRTDLVTHRSKLSLSPIAFTGPVIRLRLVPRMRDEQAL